VRVAGVKSLVLVAVVLVVVVVWGGYELFFHNHVGHILSVVGTAQPTVPSAVETPH
jgi:hypothetical protein